MAKIDPFLAFEIETKTVFIEALNSDVTLRELSLGEVTDISSDAKDDDMMYKYVALAMIEPKKTEDELKKLSARSVKVLSEIVKHIMPTKEKQGGN